MTILSRTVEQPATIVPRGRTRRIVVQNTPTAPEPVQPVARQTQVEVDAQMLELARTFFTANKASNALNRQADAARKALHKQMLSNGVTTFRTAVEIDGAVAQIEAKIDQPEAETISVEKLRTLVDDQTFMRIVSATKTAVTAHAGTNVMVAATVSIPGKEDLRIKEVAL